MTIDHGKKQRRSYDIYLRTELLLCNYILYLMIIKCFSLLIQYNVEIYVYMLVSSVQLLKYNWGFKRLYHGSYLKIVTIIGSFFTSLFLIFFKLC